MRAPTSLRWLTFSVSAGAFLAGVLVLASQATGTGLAPLPGPDDEATQVTASPADGGDVVDRLDTWSETKGRPKVSPVGKGHRHGNDKDRNRLR
jgi:hypothetical protein